MTRLSVNINKIATLRNARGEDNPNVCRVAHDCEVFGAQGITIHPRPDERHIKHADVFDLRKIVTTELNIEGYPSTDFIELVIAGGANQVTLVPDAPAAVTSSTGWDVIGNFDFLCDVVKKFKSAGIRVSIFINPDAGQIKKAVLTGTDRIELYTKPYADIFPSDKELAVAPYVSASQIAHDCGLGVNAGHDLSLVNLKWFAERLPYLDEVSIGHALICDALYLGLKNTIHSYLDCLKP